jgi:hypothetical protein
MAFIIISYPPDGIVVTMREEVVALVSFVTFVGCGTGGLDPEPQG